MIDLVGLFRSRGTSVGSGARLLAVVMVAMMLFALVPLQPAEAASYTINLLDPNGGEEITSGSTFQVRWTVSGLGGYIRIDLSVDGGEHWEGLKDILNAPAHGYGTWDWFVPPNMNETACRMRVVWVSALTKPFDTWASDESASNFTVAPGVSVSFRTVPATMSYGQYQLITFDLWDPKGMVGGLRFTWRVNDGSGFGSWGPLPGDYSNYDPSRGWIWWMPPYYESATGEIKVEALAEGTSMVMDSDITTTFEILSGTITLLKPDGGVTLLAGTTYTIEWRTSNDPSQVIMGVWIRYSTDGGSNWNTISYSTANDWSEDWVVPSTTSSEVLIEVIAQWGEWYTLDNDTSQRYNRIVAGRSPGVTLLDPNPPVDGGVVVVGGEAYNIQWETVNPSYIRTLALHYSTDNGSHWTLIGTVAGLTGPYAWTAPEVDSWAGRIKIVLTTTLGGMLETSSNHAFWIFTTIAYNRPPVANAGPDQTGTEGTTIHLDGTASYDPDGDYLGYTWRQITPSFITATLANPSYALTSFSVELSSFPVTFVFELEVTDHLEHTGFMFYNIDRVSVTVDPTPPDITTLFPLVGWEGTMMRMEGTDLMGAEVLFDDYSVLHVPTSPYPENLEPDIMVNFTIPPGVPTGVHDFKVRNMMGTDTFETQIEIFPVPEWQMENGLGFTNPSRERLNYPWNPFGETGRYRDVFGNQVYLCLWVCIGLPYWTPWDGWECLGYLIDEPFCPDPLAAILYAAAFMNLADNGECFGMSMNALRFYHNDQSISEFDPPTNATHPGNLVDENGAIRRTIDWRQGSQLSSEVLNSLLMTLINGLIPSSDISGMGVWIQTVKNYIDSGELGIASMICDHGAHAVVPYAYEETSNRIRFYVYDPNREEFSNEDTAKNAAWWTGDDAGPNNHPPYIEIDKTGVYWDWSFEWTDGTMWGDDIGLAYVPYHVLNGDRTIPTSVEGIMHILSGSASGTVENGDGGTVGVDGDGHVMMDGIEGALPLPSYKGAGDLPQSWLLPLDDSYTAKITGTGDGSYTWGMLNNGTSGLSLTGDISAGSYDDVKVDYDGGNALAAQFEYSTNDEEKPYTGSIIHRYDMRFRNFTVKTTLTDTGPHTLGTNDNYSGLKFTNGGTDPVTIDVVFTGNVVSEAVINGTSPPESPTLPSAHREGIYVGPGETVVVYPTSWLDLGNALVLVEGESEPSAPLDLAASETGGEVTLSWTTPLDDGGWPIAEYVVMRGDSEATVDVIDLVSDATTYVDGDVERGSTYYYAVLARNAVGEGPLSNVVSIEIPEFTLPSAPRDLVATYADGKVKLAWSTPMSDGGTPITGYAVMRGTDPGNMTQLKVLGVVLEYSDGSVVKDTTYYYSVVAVNSVGEGAGADSVNVEVPKGSTGDGDDDGGTPWWMFIAIIIVVFVVALLMGRMMGGRKGGPEASAPMEKEPEATKTPPPVLAEEATGDT